MSADVRVLKALDSASAISVLGTDATVDQDGTANANAFARTYAAVNRENAGSKADGSDRAWGEAFIQSGSWNAWGATLVNNKPIEKAAVSGKLVQDANQVGLGSGAFLQYKKSDEAYANIGVEQQSWTGDSPGDRQVIYADIMGPKVHSLGSSSWDGSGVSANMKDLHVEAINKYIEDPYALHTFSTDIADVDAYLWCDGTNDLQYNGLFMGVSNPVFDPAGVGQFTGLATGYLPSPTQRETWMNVSVAQP